MTRKDTILIAVVINAGLLAVLFTTAVIYDTDKGLEQTEFVAPLAENKTTPPEEQSSTLIATATTGDEVDNVLKYYTSPAPQPIVVETQPEVYVPEPIAVQSNAADEEDSSLEIPVNTNTQERFVEVTVKKGDMLEKIAKAHKTSVGAIKRANHLESERLSVGQTLKIPVKQKSSVFVEATPTPTTKPIPKQQEMKPEPKKETESTEPVYYVVKSGDNPWKIAKKFNVKFEDILRLNHLDEEKARNLKIGDRIRVK